MKHEHLGGKLKLTPMDRVTIYYDNIIIEDTQIIIGAGCKSVEVKCREADEYGQRMLDSGQWSSYVIPAITGTKCTFSDEKDLEPEEEEENMLVCKCGNKEEYKGNDMLTDEFTYTGTDGSTMYFMCDHCTEDVEFKI